MNVRFKKTDKGEVAILPRKEYEMLAAKAHGGPGVRLRKRHQKKVSEASAALALYTRRWGRSPDCGAHRITVGRKSLKYAAPSIYLGR